MSGISVGGLSSGLDTNSIIAQLTAIEQAKVTREEKKKEAAETLLEKFGELQTRLVNLANQAAGLDDMKDFNVFQTLSNNDEYAVVSGSDDAVDGQYEVVVHQLATTQKVASGSYAAINTALNLTGSFEVSTSQAAQKSDSTKKAVTISVSASDTLKDVANKINSTDGIGVRASIMSLASGENRLILTAVDEGTNGFFMKQTSGDVLGGSGLGILDSTPNSASNFSLVTLDGGAASAATKFSELTTGLTKNNLAFGNGTPGSGDAISVGLSFGDDGAGNPITQNFNFELQSGSTVQDFLDNINAQLGASGTASLNNSGEIVFTSADGSAISANMSLVNSSGTAKTGSLALGGTTSRNSFANTLNQAQNAFYTLDGMAITSQSNQDSKTITGTTFTLKKADPNVTVKVSLTQDSTAIADKIKAFVEEYNALVKFIEDNSKVTITEETGDDGKKTSTRNKGAFSGDSNISSLLTQLKSMMTSPIKELNGKTQYSSLSRIGITTGREGALTVDSDALSKALKNDLDGVRRLFSVNGFSSDPGYTLGRYTKDTQTGTYYVDIDSGLFGNKKDGSDTGTVGDLFGSIFSSTSGSSKGLSIEVPALGSSSPTQFTFVRGIANQFSWFVDKAQDYVDGFFKTSKDTYQKRIDAYDERIDTLQNRVDNYESRLIKQFTALEQAMSKISSQTSSFLSQLSN